MEGYLSAGAGAKTSAVNFDIAQCTKLFKSAWPVRSIARPKSVSSFSENFVVIVCISWWLSLVSIYHFCNISQANSYKTCKENYKFCNFSCYYGRSLLMSGHGHERLN